MPLQQSISPSTSTPAQVSTTAPAVVTGGASAHTGRGSGSTTTIRSSTHTPADVMTTKPLPTSTTTSNLTVVAAAPQDPENELTTEVSSVAALPEDDDDASNNRNRSNNANDPDVDCSNPSVVLRLSSSPEVDPSIQTPAIDSAHQRSVRRHSSRGGSNEDDGSEQPTKLAKHTESIPPQESSVAPLDDDCDDDDDDDDGDGCESSELETDATSTYLTRPDNLRGEPALMTSEESEDSMDDEAQEYFRQMAAESREIERLTQANSRLRSEMRSLLGHLDATWRFATHTALPTNTSTAAIRR